MKYVASSPLPVSVEDAFAYHERPGALQRLVPPWESVEIESTDHSLAVGSKVVLKTSFFGVPIRWVAQHTDYEPPHLFADTQLSGPFAAWNHRHHFKTIGEHSSLTERSGTFWAVGLL
jgi:ligand-binding SRPBCC domain-containing protein